MSDTKSLTNWELVSPAGPCFSWEFSFRGFSEFHGGVVTTSPIVEKLGPRLFRTFKGRVYELVGPPHPSYAGWCAATGRVVDWEDPVSLRELSPQQVLEFEARERRVQVLKSVSDVMVMLEKGEENGK